MILLASMLVACTSTPSGDAPDAASSARRAGGEVLVIETGGRPPLTLVFHGDRQVCRFTSPRDLRWLGDALAVPFLGGWKVCDLRGTDASVLDDPGGESVGAMATAVPPGTVGELGAGYRIDTRPQEATEAEQAAGQVPAVLHTPEGSTHPLGKRPVTRVWRLPGDGIAAATPATAPLDLPEAGWPVDEQGRPLATVPEPFAAAPEATAADVERWRADLSRLRRSLGPPGEDGDVILAATLPLDRQGGDDGVLCLQHGAAARCDLIVDGRYVEAVSTVPGEVALGAVAFTSPGGGYLMFVTKRRQGDRVHALGRVVRHDGLRFVVEDVVDALVETEARKTWTSHCEPGHGRLLGCPLPDGGLDLCIRGEPRHDAPLTLRVERGGDVRTITGAAAWEARTELEEITAQTLTFPDGGPVVSWQSHPRTGESVSLSWQGILLCDAPITGDWEALKGLR